MLHSPSWVRHGKVSKGEEQDWMMGAMGERAQREGEQAKSYFFTHIRPGDGRTLAWQDLLRTRTQYAHPAISCLGRSLSLPQSLPFLLFLDFQSPPGCASPSISPSVICAPMCPIWLDFLLKCLNPCMQQFKPRKSYLVIIIVQLWIGLIDKRIPKKLRSLIFNLPCWGKWLWVRISKSSEVWLVRGLIIQ